MGGAPEPRTPACAPTLWQRSRAPTRSRPTPAGTGPAPCVASPRRSISPWNSFRRAGPRYAPRPRVWGRRGLSAAGRGSGRRCRGSGGWPTAPASGPRCSEAARSRSVCRARRGWVKCTHPGTGCCTPLAKGPSAQTPRYRAELSVGRACRYRWWRQRRARASAARRWISGRRGRGPILQIPVARCVTRQRLRLFCEGDFQASARSPMVGGMQLHFPAWTQSLVSGPTMSANAKLQ